MEQYIPELGQPRAQLSKLIRPTECRKTQRSMSWWHRTVHIPCLVDSYDTHKGEHWLNSNPQTTGNKTQPIIYADDWLLLARSCEEAEEMIRMVVEVAGECGLCINKGKSSYYCIIVEKADQMKWVG